MSKPKGQIV